MILRATGYRAAYENRQVKRKSDDKVFDIPTLSVRVNEFVSLDLAVSPGLAPVIDSDTDDGDFVDLIVDVEASGGFVRARAVGFWPGFEPSKALRVAATG